MRNLTQNSMPNIYDVCGAEFGNLVEECIECFQDDIYFANDLVTSILNNISEFPIEDIKAFVASSANYIGEKDDFSSPKNLIDLVIKLLEKSKSQTWYDLGCGSGNLLVELAKKYNGVRIYGDEILKVYNSKNDIIGIDINSISREDYSLHVKKYLDIKETVVGEIFRGAQIPTLKIDEHSKIEEGEKAYYLLSTGDIQNGFFELDKLQKYKDDGKFDRYLVKNGDVIVSSKSTKVKTAVVNIPDNAKVVAIGSLLIIRCNKEKINPVYLKTFFDSSNGRKLLESIQTGTTIISINASALMKMRVSCPNMVKQNEIAEKYLLTLEQFKKVRNKLLEFEKALVNIYDKYQK